jgi:hypothetical protein
MEVEVAVDVALAVKVVEEVEGERFAGEATRDMQRRQRRAIPR